MKIALVGARGKLGAYLRRFWGTDHELALLTRAEVDLRDGDALRRQLEGREFEAVVNCAAMASPEACEADREGADLVNAAAPEVMAQVCGEREVRFLHFSTDYVVDGREKGLKDEAAALAPIGNYGSSKLEGEQRVLAACPGALICRVSWVFGEGVPSFLHTILSRARAGERLTAVADKWSKPTSARDIAVAVERLLVRPSAVGVLHLVNRGDPVSWRGYAERVVAIAVDEGILPEVVPVGRTYLAEIPQLSAPRPIHTALGSIRQEELLGETMPHWEDRAAEEARVWAAGECH